MWCVPQGKFQLSKPGIESRPFFCSPGLSLLLVVLLSLWSVSHRVNAASDNTVAQAAPFYGNVETTSLRKPRYGHGSVSDGRFVYLFGGSTNRGIIGDVEIIDLKTNRIQVLEDKTFARRYIDAVWDGGTQVYLMGGISPKGLAGIVEVFNIETHEVTRLADHPFPTRINTAEYVDGKIYVFGGSVCGQGVIEPVNRVYVYDIAQDSWSREADMPVAKETRSVKYGDFIYLVGGYNYQSSLSGFERYDLRTGEWEYLADLPVPLSAHSAVVAGDYLYTFGNYHDLADTWRYSFTDDSWTRLEPSYSPRRHTSAVLTDEGIALSGGTTQTRGGATSVLDILSDK